MASSPKFPIERRWRNGSPPDPLDLSKKATLPMRRESDAVRARLQRWIDLANKALGIAKSQPRNGHPKH